MLAHNHKAFNQLSKLCPGETKKHRHLPWGTTPSGHFATSEETAYPIQLARDVAQCFKQALAEAGMKLPPNQLQDMTSSSEAVLQAVRAQSGVRPKNSKLPPLVPESIVAVEVSSDTPSSQPPHSQIPQHSKFLNSAPLVTAPVKGGGYECRPSENSASDRIVQKWGVYRTPEEFVRKAAQAQAGYPLSLETCLPEILKLALQSHKNQTSIARIKKRTVVMREWVKSPRR